MSIIIISEVLISFIVESSLSVTISIYIATGLSERVHPSSPFSSVDGGGGRGRGVTGEGGGGERGGVGLIIWGLISLSLSQIDISAVTCERTTFPWPNFYSSWVVLLGTSSLG